MDTNDNKQWVDDLLKNIEEKQHDQEGVYYYLIRLFDRIRKEESHPGTLTTSDKMVVQEALVMSCDPDNVSSTLKEDRYKLLLEACKKLAQAMNNALALIKKNRFLPEGETGYVLFKTLLDFTDNSTKMTQESGLYLYMFVANMLHCLQKEFETA